MKKILILAAILLSTSIQAANSIPVCSKSTISGLYRFQENNKMGELLLKQDGTYVVTFISLEFGKQVRSFKEAGTFTYVSGCAAVLLVDGYSEEYPILFSNTVVVKGKRYPNAGVWKSGSMFRKISK